MYIFQFIFLVLGFLNYSVSGIMFELPPNNQRCLRQEMDRDTLILGDFAVTPIQGQEVHYVVRDSKEHILAKNDNVTSGKFTFSTETADVFEICFISRVPSYYRGIPHHVMLNIKAGIEAKSYEALLTSGKLKPMEVELKKLEDLAASIVRDFENMKKQEVKMRNTNESTNSRIFYLSLFIMVVLVSISSWQIFYLRRYFKSRKLIE